MIDELVAQLRVGGDDADICHQAADEILRLKTELALQILARSYDPKWQTRAEGAEELVKEYSARMIRVRQYCHDCLGAQMTAMPITVLALIDGKELP